jgi:hypothetical protein
LSLRIFPNKLSFFFFLSFVTHFNVKGLITLLHAK